MMNIRPTTAMTNARRAARDRNVKRLLELGWIRLGPDEWRNPNTILKLTTYSTCSAINIAQMNGGIRVNGHHLKI